jgi:DNA-binding NtrC family response regulator
MTNAATQKTARKRRETDTMSGMTADAAFVLIVEEGIAEGRALAELLQRSHFLCSVVEDAPAAIESICRRPPDVVVIRFGAAGAANHLTVLRETKRRNPE